MRGGKREGAGRPALGIERKAYSFKLTPDEREKVKKYISELHKETNEKLKQQTSKAG